MKTLNQGLYEQLLTTSLAEAVNQLASDQRAVISTLEPVEAADRLTLFFSRVLRRTIESLSPEQRREAGIAIVRKFIAELADTSNAIDEEDTPIPGGQVLRAINALKPDGTPNTCETPATPLLDTSLLTNAPGEPRLLFQIKSEIPSADAIDVLMAFVRRSGIHPLLARLRDHVAAGKPLRILTTTYTGSTELAALDELQALGADIRVSYDTSTTRLHAKAWLFHRTSGFSTAFIGSSNLTHSAQVSGLEWNVRIAAARNQDVIDKFQAVFESYWASGDFKPFDRNEFQSQTRAAASGPMVYLNPLEIEPRPFQSRLLEQIALARVQGHHRNLLVAATGTGKTVMAALDYQRLRKILPRSRLLFVAHRKEILEQTLATFRHALRDAAFGELWVGGAKPSRFEHVFASIQSLAAAGLAHLEPDHFDVVIVDEFHHAAAATYDALLKHIAPKELLGLTATPERGDGQPILHWFDDRIAAELRLWDAIDQQRLVPFAYFGISDGTDLRKIGWKRGRGYDAKELSNLVTGDTALAHRIIDNVVRTVPNPETMRALGFCVSVEHADFMAEQFNRAHLPAVAVNAATPAEARHEALAGLAQGKLRAVFSVDLFNEGVDIPSADTLLLLRPTDSATLYLQQLGRGLRRDRSSGKTCCTVLDFVGSHRNEFQFLSRFRALLGGTRKTITRQIEQGFPFLPSGCHMEFDAVAREAVLTNIRRSLPYTQRARANELRQIAETHGPVTLARFLAESGLELEDIYSNNHNWSDLLEAGGISTLPSGPFERVLRKAIGRMLHVNDLLRIAHYRAWIQSAEVPNLDAMPSRERRLLHMMVAVLLESVPDKPETLNDCARLLWQHPQILSEMDQLLAVLSDRINHLPVELATHPEVPLRVHASYTRREILAAFGDGVNTRLPEWREGVRWLPEHQVDLLAITLDKSDKHFSPTTRYRDYTVSPELLHWESQSTLRAASPTGQRYKQHTQDSGSFALPFVRLNNDDRAFWLLGPATYVNHEGERPMAITWRLAHPVPGDLFTQFAAVSG